jgi:hypothetical protein
MEMHLEDDELDTRLRSAVEPDPRIIDRVVKSALAVPSRRITPARIAAWAVLALSVSLMILFFSRKPPNPPLEVFHLEYVGNLAVLEYPDGSTCLLTPDLTERGPQPQLNLIIVGGDKP